MLIVLAFIIALIFLSAYVSGSEVAFFSLSPKDIEDMQQQKNSKRVLVLLDKPNHLLATILIANNLINIAIVVLSVYFTNQVFSFEKGSFIEFFIQVVAITTLLVLFGEITPKIYANQNARSFAVTMSKPILFMQKLFMPISFMLVSITDIIDKKLSKNYANFSVEEISQALELTELKDKEDEKRILRSIVQFGSTDVKEIMKSRVDVLAINQDLDLENVLTIIKSSGYSRIPVYKDSLDNIVGILYIKDLIPFIDKSAGFNWVKLCRIPYYVPENKMIHDLLKDFQVKKNHLAIVVDEYGGVSGIVTLEDVLEEIVGDINDEFDIDNNIYSKLDNNNFIFNGNISLIDFLKIVKGKTDYFDNIKGESDSLAGLVLEIEGRIPKIGTVCKIPPYNITVEAVDMRSIKRLKVNINEK